MIISPVKQNTQRMESAISGPTFRHFIIIIHTKCKQRTKTLHVNKPQNNYQYRVFKWQWRSQWIRGGKSRYWKEEVIWELDSFMGLIELPFQLLVFGVLNTGLITELYRGGGKGDSEFIARLDQRQYGLRTNISVIRPRLASHNRSPFAFTPSQDIFF
jgi:hypothetical protein